MDITKEQSSAFWTIKALAIFTVFFAHMPGQGPNAGYFDTVGLIGVPLFLICAGFFFESSRRLKLGEFVRKKVKTLLVPLLIWGTVTYLIHALKAQDAGFVAYLKWVVGIGSWLYFVPVLLCCQFLARYLGKIVLLLLGLCSMFLSWRGLIPYSVNFTPYINPFNFIGYFAMGLYLRDCQGWMKWKPVWGTVLLAVSILTMIFIKPVYWHPWSQLIALVLFLGCFTIFRTFRADWLDTVGKISFVVYLSHIQIAGAVDGLCKGLWGTPLEFMKVITAFIIVVLIIQGINQLLIRLKWDSVRQALGYRS